MSSIFADFSCDFDRNGEDVPEMTNYPSNFFFLVYKK